MHNFVDYVGPKHKIQSMRSLWKAEHVHTDSLHDLIPCGSQEIYEKLSTNDIKMSI